MLIVQEDFFLKTHYLLRLAQTPTSFGNIKSILIYTFIIKDVISNIVLLHNWKYCKAVNFMVSKIGPVSTTGSGVILLTALMKSVLEGRTATSAIVQVIEYVMKVQKHCQQFTLGL